MQSPSVTGKPIEFICRPDDRGSIPEPQAASNVLPQWYKMLARSMGGPEEGEKFTERTIRNCPAFLDALSLGWILPVESDVKVNTETPAGERDIELDDDGAGTATARELGSGEYDDNVVTTIEFHSSWAAKAPDGYSILVVPALNRREQRFTVIGQMIDADQTLATIDVPVLWHADNARTIIREGEPLAQVIPIHRDSRIETAALRAFGREGRDSYDRTVKKTSTNRSWYRQNAWEAKGTRLITE